MIRRVRIKKGVRPYGGRVVDVVSQDAERVVVWIKPVGRTYLLSEVEAL
jgi:hypothetical protein